MAVAGDSSLMNVNINFPTEIENALRHTAAASGKDVETVVREIVAERFFEEPALPLKRKISHDEFMARVRGIIARHGISTGNMDDSRESIYEGRGE